MSFARGLALVELVIAAACASSPANNEHGPSYGADAGDDGQELDATEAAVVDTSMPVESGPVEAGGEGGMMAEAGMDSPADSPERDHSVADAHEDHEDDASTCSSTMALLATGTTTVTESRFVKGEWSTAASVPGGGSAPPVGPALVTLGTGYLGAFAAVTTEYLEGTGYTSSWSSPVQIGPSGAPDATQGTPALATIGTTAHLVYWGTDGKFYHGTYTASAWDDGSDKIEASDAAQSFGSCPPALAAVGSTLLVAQSGSDGTLYDQTWTAGVWGGATGHAGTSLVTTLSPAVAALTGKADAMIVFVHAGDYYFQYTTRTAGVWSTPVDVYDKGGVIALANGTVAPTLAALPKGGAVLAWQGSDTFPYASVFDGTSWTAPASLTASVAVASGPAVAAGVCGANAVAAFVNASSGDVEVASLVGSSWSTPVPISGTTGMQSVAIASVP